MGARTVRANGLRFAYLEAGPPDGVLALCLHGFPDHPGTWRHLVPALAAAGFRAVAPWLRGYPPTQMPDTATVDTDVVTADVNALHRALGGTGDAVLVGHDWGAIAGMRAAVAAPDRWRRLVTLAVPPERVFTSARWDVDQVRRLAYALDAQLPGAVHRFGRDDGAKLIALWRRWSPGYEPVEADLAPLRAMIQDPATVRVMLGYYTGFRRQVLRRRALARRVLPPPQPHLVLHGADDGGIRVDWARRAASLLPNPASRVVVLEGAGHHLHLERPDEVARLVIDHLGVRS